MRGTIADATALLDALAKAGYEPEGLSVESEKDFSIQLKSGPLILASFAMDAPTIVKNLQTALGEDSLKGKLPTLKYIDLRFGNRMYYK